jgi:hypothetical protein
MDAPIYVLSEPDLPDLIPHRTKTGAFKMTFENVSLMDRAANFVGSIALLAGLAMGAAMFISASI